MLANYIPIVIFLAIALVVGIVPMLAGRLLSKRVPEAAKDSPYECGFEAFEDSRMRFDVRYYLVAILFIIFDLENCFSFSVGGGGARNRSGGIIGDGFLFGDFGHRVYL